jgi:hypothetical protein
MGTGSVLGNNQNSGQAGYGPSYGNTSINQPFQNGAATPQGTTPILPTQPRPFYGMGNDIRNVQGTVLPTDADYQGQNTAVQMFGGMPQGTTPVMPAQPIQRNFGTGAQMQTYDGSGSVMQMFGGMPQGTTPVMPVAPPPRNFGTGVQMPTYDGSGSVMQSFGGMPLGTTPPRPVAPPVRNFGTGAQIGNAVQMFGRLPPSMPMTQPAVSPVKQKAMAKALRRR